MKKTYIVPAAEAAKFYAGVICKTSMKLDDESPIGGSDALTRQQFWADDEE